MTGMQVIKSKRRQVQRCREHLSQACRRRALWEGLEQEDRWAHGEAMPAEPTQGGFQAHPSVLGREVQESLSSLDSGERWYEWIAPEKGGGKKKKKSSVCLIQVWGNRREPACQGERKQYGILTPEKPGPLQSARLGKLCCVKSC